MRRDRDGEQLDDDEGDGAPAAPATCLRHPHKPALMLGFCRACCGSSSELELIEEASELMADQR